MNTEKFRERRDSFVKKLARGIVLLATLGALVAVASLGIEDLKSAGQAYLAVYVFFLVVMILVTLTRAINAHKGESMWGWLIVWGIVTFAGGALGGIAGAVIGAVGAPMLFWVVKTAAWSIHKKMTGNGE